MAKLKFDFNNMFSFSVGAKDGVSGKDIAGYAKLAGKAADHLAAVLKDMQDHEGNQVDFSLVIKEA